MCDGQDKSEPLGRLLEAIQSFVDTPIDEVAPAELGERLIRLRHGIDLLELAFAAEAAAFAATDEYEVQESLSAIDWIRHHCHMSVQAASRSVVAGEQAPTLPESVEAFNEGRIGFGHLALMASSARAIKASLTAGAFEERPLLDLALEHSVSRFGFDCTHARHAADAAAMLAEHVQAVERRRLELIDCEGGVLAIRGLLDPVAGATLRTALEPLAKPSGAGDNRDRAHRLADALVELAAHCLDAGTLPDRGGQRTHLQLTASVETVMGLNGAPGGDLEYAGAVPAATVQRLACDASVRRVLLGPDSAVIDVGRALRLPSGAARAALRVRDRGSVWPGCDRPASWTNAHHVRHWGHGGDTDLRNLVLLCFRHHWSVHEGGWQLAASDDGRVHAIPPHHRHRTWTRAPDSNAAA